MTIERRQRLQLEERRLISKCDRTIQHRSLKVLCWDRVGGNEPEKIINYYELHASHITTEFYATCYF